MVPRYLISVGLAAGVTLGLFLLMHSLVALGSGKVLEEQEERVVIDFVRLRREPELPVQEQELPTKALPRVQPPPPRLEAPHGPRPDPGALRVAMPVVSEPARSVKLVGGPGLGDAAPSDASATPLVRIQPIYPPDARQRRIEGWVTMRFTISATGAVKDPVVVEANPPGVFDSAALRALRRWKYRPRVEEGRAVEKRGLKVRLSFRLDRARGGGS
jgi:protein TonB